MLQPSKLDRRVRFPLPAPGPWFSKASKLQQAMKTKPTLQLVALCAAALLTPHGARAGDVSRCDKIAQQVRAAIEKEPQKILVIVEDNMVANEPCACEIVKAAILASKADGDMVRQIVMTATHVSPAMSRVIADCASAVAPDHSDKINDAVSKTTGVQPVGEVPSSGVEPEGTDYTKAPPDIRGVYLIQPSTSVESTPSNPPGEPEPKPRKFFIHKHNPPVQPTPQSPSNAVPGP
jgi:hypothetical protein